MTADTLPQRVRGEALAQAQADYPPQTWRGGDYPMSCQTYVPELDVLDDPTTDETEQPTEPRPETDEDADQLVAA